MSRTALPMSEPADRSAVFADLQKAIQGEVRFDRLTRGLYSTDASVYQIVPLGVVLPRCEEDVVATVRICAQHGIPLTARGGGTSQAGQCIGPGIILDCSKFFHEVLQINADERWARVRPGCVLEDLNLALRPHGLQFAPDISTANRATIGGMIANNSSGTHSIIHGKTIDHVWELRGILSDGSVIYARPLSTPEVDARCLQQDREGRVIASSADWPTSMQRRSIAAIRRSCAASVGITSIASPAWGRVGSISRICSSARKEHSASWSRRSFG